jgi:hypothetical protein
VRRLKDAWYLNWLKGQFSFFRGNDLHSQNFSFVVRIWLESTYSDGKNSIWRGSIEQVGSDCRIYFSDLDGITRFIQTQIDLEPSPPATGLRLTLEQMQNGVRKFWKRLFRRNP